VTHGFDPLHFNADRFLATKDRAPEMDPSEFDEFGFGIRQNSYAKTEGEAY